MQCWSMTESEAWAVTSWEVGSCVMTVHETKQVGFRWVFESLDRGSISYGGWDFISNQGGTVAEGTTVDCRSQSFQLEDSAAADWMSAGLTWADKETEVN